MIKIMDMHTAIKHKIAYFKRVKSDTLYKFNNLYFYFI